jgi:hypothetical protein
MENISSVSSVMTKLEVKQKFCELLNVDNPRLFHVESGDYILPPLTEVVEALKPFNPHQELYGPRFRCFNFAVRLADFLAGRGWPVAVVVIDTPEEHDHTIVSILLSDGTYVLIEPQTKRNYSSGFTTNWGFVA